MHRQATDKLIQIPSYKNLQTVIIKGKLRIVPNCANGKMCTNMEKLHLR